MYFPDVQTYIEKLEQDNELVRVRAEVDPYLEATTIIDRVCKGASKKRALLFENVKGSNIPLAANLFGTKSRVEKALGVVSIEDMADQLRSDLSCYKGMDSDVAFAKVISSGVCAEENKPVKPEFIVNETELGLNILPALHSWPGDVGRYLTLGQIFTRHPEGGQQNCGMYRVQIVDKETALLRCHAGSGGDTHMQAWRARGETMPIVIVLGGPPALTWCAGLSLPGDVSELDLVRYLTGQTVSVSGGLNSDLVVPSTAEVVIEGTVQLKQMQQEGPFANHTGYYSPVSPAPVIKITSIKMKENAVYPCTVVGPPPMENSFLAKACECLLMPLAQHENPWIVNVRIPSQGSYSRAGFVSVDAPGFSIEEISQCLWKTRLLRNSRFLVLFDGDVNLDACQEIYWKTINAGPWENSLLCEGQKLVIDARSMPGREKVSQSTKVLNDVFARWQSLGLD